MNEFLVIQEVTKPAEYATPSSLSTNTFHYSYTIRSQNIGFHFLKRRINLGEKVEYMQQSIVISILQPITEAIRETFHYITKQMLMNTQRMDRKAKTSDYSLGEASNNRIAATLQREL